MLGVRPIIRIFVGINMENWDLRVIGADNPASFDWRNRDTCYLRLLLQRTEERITRCLLRDQLRYLSTLLRAFPFQDQVRQPQNEVQTLR